VRILAVVVLCLLLACFVRSSVNLRSANAAQAAVIASFDGQDVLVVAFGGKGNRIEARGVLRTSHLGRGVLILDDGGRSRSIHLSHVVGIQSADRSVGSWFEQEGGGA
jgi:hypothetical protein